MGDLTQIALGNNNSGDLQLVYIQPDYDGLEYPREIPVPSGDIIPDGKPFVTLHFPDMVAPGDWVILLAQFGLLSARTALVTVRLLNEDKTTSTLYNGRAVKKQYDQVIRHAMCWYEKPEIDVVRLTPIP